MLVERCVCVCRQSFADHFWCFTFFYIKLIVWKFCAIGVSGAAEEEEPPRGVTCCRLRVIDMMLNCTLLDSEGLKSFNAVDHTQFLLSNSAVCITIVSLE